MSGPWPATETSTRTAVANQRGVLVGFLTCPVLSVPQTRVCVWVDLLLALALTYHSSRESCCQLSISPGNGIPRLAACTRGVTPGQIDSIVRSMAAELSERRFLGKLSDGGCTAKIVPATETGTENSNKVGVLGGTCVCPVFSVPQDWDFSEAPLPAVSLASFCSRDPC